MRISRPLLDRIDIHLEVPRIPHEQFADRRAGEFFEAIRERVERARQIQTTGFAATVMRSNMVVPVRAVLVEGKGVSGRREP